MMELRNIADPEARKCRIQRYGGAVCRDERRSLPFRQNGRQHMNQMLADLGDLVTRIGRANFVATMHKLVARRVPVDGIILTEWAADDSNQTINVVRTHGYAGIASDHACTAHREIEALRSIDSLRRCILSDPDSQLIHLGKSDLIAKQCVDGKESFRCVLVSQRLKSRYVISLHRSNGRNDFMLRELSTLKNLSEVLLPVAEQHARSCTDTPSDLEGLSFEGQEESGVALLERKFEKCLTKQGISLSTREKQVCLLLLTGRTTPAIAGVLSINRTTVETYVKRAGIKLGLTGRHGLLKWLISGDCDLGTDDHL
ncbi:response regulator transcription factor [Paraburkholderia fungorum]|uniref:response regulator transcription factor n=1 Tax=Paraburkholderia fungorum TaxID=134537 RepID=UPI0038BCA49B